MATVTARTVNDHRTGQIMEKIMGILSAIVITLSFGLGTAQAATVTWNGSGDMTWSQPDSTSWDSAEKPRPEWSALAQVSGATSARASSPCASPACPRGAATG